MVGHLDSQSVLGVVVVVVGESEKTTYYHHESKSGKEWREKKRGTRGSS